MRQKRQEADDRLPLYLAPPGGDGKVARERDW